MAGGDVESKPKRERKQVEAFQAGPAVSEKKADKVQAGKGSGKALGEIEHVNHQLGKTNADAEFLKCVHQILYRSVGNKAGRKKEIRKWNGFADESVVDGLIEKITANKKMTVGIMKEMAELCGLEKSGTRDDLIKRVLSFFAKPHDTTKAGGASKKRKSSGAKKKAGGKSKKAKKVKSGEKRSPTSYICFCNEVRDSVKKETPEMAQKDLLRKCGEMWQALGEAGQAKYKKQAEELKKAAEAKKKEGDHKEEADEEEEEEDEDIEIEDDDDEEEEEGEEQEEQGKAEEEEEEEKKTAGEAGGEAGSDEAEEEE